MAFSTNTNEHLIRSNLWSRDLKEAFETELFAMRYVKMVSDFPDGDTLNIPSIGQAEISDYAEGMPVTYTSFDTGNFTFTINRYKSSATYITNKMKQDSYVFAELMSQFVPKQNRGIMTSMETDLLAVGPDNQTASDTNTINDGRHRMIGSGTNETIAVADFARATHALKKANVPNTNWVAIVDPTVEYTLKTISNLVTLDSNPRWEGVMRDDMVTGTKFSFSILGWDVYVSQNLKQNVNESIDGTTSGAGVANLFFCATGDASPFIGQVRQTPKVDSEYNKDYQREEFVTTARWGWDLFRPESLVTIITDTDQVYA